jgi:glutamyl-tRNA reductase
VRRAEARAIEAADLAGGLLGAAFASALRAGRRVRAETGVGRLAVSVPSVARDLARRIFGDLAGREALLLGTGEVAEAAARYLRGEGMRLVIASFRRRERAEALAAELGAEVVSFDAIAPYLARVDVVLASTAAPHVVLTRDQIEAARNEREGKSLFLIDIAMPRDIDPAAAEIEGVFLYTLVDLEEIAEEHRAKRAAEIEEAERIVEEEVARFQRREAAILAGPTLAALASRAEEIRRKECEAALARLGPALSPRVRAVVERLSRDLVARLLHDPLVEAKRLEEIPVEEKIHLLRRLFRL